MNAQVKTTPQLKFYYALALAILNGVIIALTYLATQNIANGITITVGVGAVLAGIEGAIHYAEAQPGTSTDTQTLLTTINSTLEAVKGVLASLQGAQHPPASTPSTTAVASPFPLTYKGWTIDVLHGIITLVPPPDIAQALGPKFDIGSAGTLTDTQIISMAQASVDNHISIYQTTTKTNPVTPP